MWLGLWGWQPRRAHGCRSRGATPPALLSHTQLCPVRSVTPEVTSTPRASVTSCAKNQSLRGRRGPVAQRSRAQVNQGRGTHIHGRAPARPGTHRAALSSSRRSRARCKCAPGNSSGPPWSSWEEHGKGSLTRLRAEAAQPPGRGHSLTGDVREKPGPRPG